MIRNNLFVQVFRAENGHDLFHNKPFHLPGRFPFSGLDFAGNQPSVRIKNRGPIT